MKKMTAAVLSAALLAAVGSNACAYDKSLPLPDVNTEFKTYMDYRTITDTSSAQYDLQQHAYTDSQGIRRVDGDVCVALGTAYADSCGERFEITLDSGNSFTAVVGDIKADCHTDPSNRYVELWEGHGDMVEFIVETEELDDDIRLIAAKIECTKLCSGSAYGAYFGMSGRIAGSGDTIYSGGNYLSLFSGNHSTERTSTVLDILL